MSNNQYSRSYASSIGKSTTVNFQSVNPYAGLVATAGPENDGRSSSSGSPPFCGSSVALFAHTEGAVIPVTPSRSHAHSSRAPQPHIYSSPEQSRAIGSSAISTPTRVNYAAPANDQPTTGLVSISSTRCPPNTTYNYQRSQTSFLVGVPESVAAQETAFRQGQRDSSNGVDDVPVNPFARQFDQLWKAFYELGKECGSQRVPSPVSLSQQNFAWPVLINPYTQSLKYPNGSLDPAWSRKMILAALSCMEELVRITCRRNTGWDKTVVDIPLPAQEALATFPDLAQQYEQLKRDAKEAHAGGRPYGY